MIRNQLDQAAAFIAPPRLDDFPSAEERAAERAFVAAALRFAASGLNRIADALAPDEAPSIRVRPAIRRN